MKIYSALIGILLIGLFVAVGSAQGASTTTSTSTSSSTGSVSSSTTLTAEQALSNVAITSVTVDPQEFYPYEQGTITVVVTNTGGQEVALKSADILNSNVYLPDELHNPYQTMMYLGPGNSQTFTFHVIAVPPEGIYYPVFGLASRDAGSIYYPITVQISSMPIIDAISQKPDYFAINNTDNVNLTITNPREGAISNVIITPTGSGFGISPLQTFIASVPGDSSINVPFAITPYTGGSAVNFTVQYSNGQTVQNLHTDVVNLPLTIGTSKTAASMDINDLALALTDGGYQLTGDVTNTGITDANGLVVSVESPAQPIQPYSSYAVGSLTSNDFSSFTLTFTGNDLSAIPIKTTWRDDNGNTLSMVQTVDLRSLANTLYSSSRSGGSGSSTGAVSAGSNAAAGGFAGGARGGGGGIFGFGGGRGGGVSAFYPIIIGGIIAIVAIVLYVKRKWVLAKIRKQ